MFVSEDPISCQQDLLFARSGSSEIAQIFESGREISLRCHGVRMFVSEDPALGQQDLLEARSGADEIA